MIDKADFQAYCLNMKTAFFLMALLVGFVSASEKVVKFEVSGIKFTAPPKWISQKTTSRMRAAQFGVPDVKGKPPAQCVFYYFGPGEAGGVDANIKRWIGQFAPEPKIKHTVKSEKLNNVAVTHITAEGTYMDGPPFGAKVPKKGFAMRGAIVLAPRGAIFIKMTGPKAVVVAAEKPFSEMLTSAFK